MSLEILHPGFLTLVQDFGRFGLKGSGITQGGPLDEHAYLWANRLLHNSYNAPQLEVSFGAFSARFNKNTMIALCGADLSATINGTVLPLWQSYYVKAGDEIRFVSPKSGARAYLAIKGGFKVEPQLSSCSTVIREGIGGLTQRGEKVEDNQRIPYASSREELSHRVPTTFIPEYTSKVHLRFIPNRSQTGCKNEAIQALVEQPFKVSQQIDRMGFRLEGKVIQQASAGIISQGISLGAIQLPKDGQPIVLMKDHQTMGGYPQLGCVAYLDLARLAQALPGTEVRFTAVEITDLEDELVQYKRFFNLRN